MPTKSPDSKDNRSLHHANFPQEHTTFRIKRSHLAMTTMLAIIACLFAIWMALEGYFPIAVILLVFAVYQLIDRAKTKQHYLTLTTEAVILGTKHLKTIRYSDITELRLQASQLVIRQAKIRSITIPVEFQDAGLAATMLIRKLVELKRLSHVELKGRTQEILIAAQPKQLLTFRSPYNGFARTVERFLDRIFKQQSTRS